MTSNSAPALETPAIKVVLKAALYYAILLTVGAFAWREGRAIPPIKGTVAPTVIIAMLAALLLSLPVAWMYLLTRAKRGYQQSVVQLLIMLPIVVSGVVVLVKDSLALAFSLAGIVAAVRFRNTLDDSKDAVYVFLATGIGLAAAVDVPVAAAISVIFNAMVLILWYTDFGSAPVELEGRIAQRRLKRARDLSRTGTFVAQIDAEVLKNMTSEQLEGVAQRAWRRARDQGPPGDGGNASAETRLRLRTTDVERTRSLLEPRIDEHAKEWRLDSRKDEEDGTGVIDYVVHLKKKHHPDDLVALARATSGVELVDAELR